MPANLIEVSNTIQRKLPKGMKLEYLQKTYDINGNIMFQAFKPSVIQGGVRYFGSFNPHTQIIALISSDELWDAVKQKENFTKNEFMDDISLDIDQNEIHITTNNDDRTTLYIVYLRVVNNQLDVYKITAQ